MKRILLAFAAVIGLSATAQATTIVNYDQWTELPHCGGLTRLKCDGPRQQNKCRIEFRNVYTCQNIKMYVGNDFHPNFRTFESDLKGSFYVDNAKVAYTIFLGVPVLNVFLSRSANDNTPHDKIQYRFNY